MQSAVSETFFARATKIIDHPRLALIHPFDRKTPFALKIHSSDLYAEHLKNLKERRVLRVIREGLDVAASPSGSLGSFQIRCCHTCWSSESGCDTGRGHGRIFVSTSTGCICCGGTGIKLDETLSPCQCSTVLGPAEASEKMIGSHIPHSPDRRQTYIT